MPVVPADTRQVLAGIAGNTSISPQVRTELVQAVAAADSVGESSLRSDLMSQVGGLGVYFSQTKSEGWPRWDVLTALRTYGLNLKANQQVGGSGVEVARSAQAKLEQVARKEGGVSMEQVQVVVKQTAAGGEAQPAQNSGHKVEMVA
ncbi:MAG: hypothetical protein GC129_02750 [Proteobacteria bacterium]|nr:hypothetical protein [Pseudomonadota bacterium]